MTEKSNEKFILAGLTFFIQFDCPVDDDDDPEGVFPNEQKWKMKNCLFLKKKKILKMEKK